MIQNFIQKHYLGNSLVNIKSQVSTIYNFNMFSAKISKKMMKQFYHTIRDEIQFSETFSKTLLKKLSQRPSNEFLRLQISAGEGCEGYKYSFKFDTKLQPNDFVKSEKQQKVIFAIGEEQIKLVRGSLLDYATEMMRQMFYVKQNPNAEISCSCKTSFSPKDTLI